MNAFQQLKEKKVLDKDGKVDALGPYGRMKLTGREVATYFRKNKVRDKEIRKDIIENPNKSSRKIIIEHAKSLKKSWL